MEPEHKLALNSLYGKDQANYIRMYNLIFSRYTPTEYVPLTRWERIHLRLAIMRGDIAAYFITLGHAIIGREVCDCDTPYD